VHGFGRGEAMPVQEELHGDGSELAKSGRNTVTGAAVASGEYFGGDLGREGLAAIPPFLSFPFLCFQKVGFALQENRDAVFSRLVKDLQ
jgi:hypothetical protein